MSDRFPFLALAGTDPLRLEPPFSASYPDASKYLPVGGLAEAFDAAMMLGMPLLLTGEPGTGKTRAAYWLQSQLGAPLLRHDVKSTQSGRDLLYRFDDVARFRDGAARPLIDYVQFSALGEAIVRAIGGTAALQPLHPGATITEGAFVPGLAEMPSTANLLPQDPDFATADPQHCIVLIDELDKAPRDTPNDLLSEIEDMAFAIPELGVRVEADTDWRPIVIITSNSERSLPEPFLRRCLYFDIPPPGEVELAAIVAQSVEGVAAGTPLFQSCWRFYARLRSEDGVRKRPGTAEFLAWASCLVAQGGFHPEDAIVGDAAVAARVAPTLVCLVKSADDRALASRLLSAGGW